MTDEAIARREAEAAWDLGSMGTRSHEQTLCTHERLGFASGGYYVQCTDCSQMWVALKPNGANNGDLGYVGPILSMWDQRISRQAAAGYLSRHQSDRERIEALEAEVARLTGEWTGWLIEETWSGYVHYVHRDFNCAAWAAECRRNDIRRCYGMPSRHSVPIVTKKVEEAMRFPTKEAAELWLGLQPRWMSAGEQYQIREHMALASPALAAETQEQDAEPVIPVDMTVNRTRFRKGVTVATVQGAIDRLIVYQARLLLSVMDQADADLKSAHAEICKLQGLDPNAHDWPEWSPQANSIRWHAQLRAETQEQGA